MDGWMDWDVHNLDGWFDGVLMDDGMDGWLDDL
jgi:hypothetical protein